MNKRVTVREFEKQVLELEGIPIVLFAASDARVDEYSYKNREDAKSTVSAWMKRRIQTKLYGMEFALLGSDYRIGTPHGGTQMGKLRARYQVAADKA